MKRRIVPGGILALSLAVVLMGATASTASAERYIGKWNCPPLPPAPSWPADDPQIRGCVDPLWIVPPAFYEGDTLGYLDFGHHKLGTSASQRVALGVIGDTFSPRIGVSGDVDGGDYGDSDDYAQTNNCPPTLSAPEGRVNGCLIEVTFTPTGKGPRRGILTTGGTGSMTLTGTGPAPTDPPQLQLSGKKKQSLRQERRDCVDHCDHWQPYVRVKASCGDVECTTREKGKLTHLKNIRLERGNGPPWVAPGKTETVELTLTTKKGHRIPHTRAWRRLRKALAEGKNVKAKVTVRARNAAGVATAKRTIRLVK